MPSLKILVIRLFSRLNAFFGRGLVVSIGAIVILCLLLSVTAFTFLNTAAPRTLTLTAGPAGSSFERHAEKYRAILAREGVTLKILPSAGSSENLKRLSERKPTADVGFVLGGERAAALPADTAAKARPPDRLVSLGSVAYQPLLVFYRGERRTLLAQFAGQRLNIGPAGSGSHRLATALLKANGITPGESTTFDEAMLADPGKALLEGQVDALFVMGDSTAVNAIRQLLRAGTVRLFDFDQVDAYVRRFPVLNKLYLPRGALDLGKDVPAEDVWLVAPTVELIARDSLHPALADLLLEAAREVHGSASLFRKRGEFPALRDGEFRASPDAERYYASGKSFLYRNLPFWLASLTARILAFLLPIVLLLLPALKFAPLIYRWRFESRIYRWYQLLFEVERESFKPGVDAVRRRELLAQLDHIENGVNRIVIPAAFGDLFYALRGHIRFVRRNLLAQEQAVQP